MSEPGANMLVDDGYETDATDATILDEDYDSEYEREYMRKQAAKEREEKSQEPPRTPPPRMYGPDPPTEMVKQDGQRLFARVVENGKLKFIPYTTNDARNGLPMYDQDGAQVNPERLFPGGASKSRRRSAKKRTSRRRKSKRSRRRRKTTRRYRK